MAWEILDTGRRSAKDNMLIDAYLLETLGERQDPIVHFYEWEGDSATYGCLTNPKDYLNEEAVRRQGLSLAQRSTGGGIVFHSWDFAFSFLVPSTSEFFSSNTLDNYAFINTIVCRAAEEFLGSCSLSLTACDFQEKDSACRKFCMAGPTKYDVVLEGRKIAGAAQRKCKQGFLHQGMIALSTPPEEYLEAVLLPGSYVKESIIKNTFPLLEKSALKDDRDFARYKLKELIQKHLYPFPFNRVQKD